MDDVQKSITYLTEVETVAQDILTAKEQKLNLSNARNKHNEALRAIEKSEEKRFHIQLSNTFFQFPKSLSMNILKEDMAAFTEEINDLEQDIKGKVSTLRDLEHQPGIVGFSLKPLSHAEAKAINDAFRC